jgi:hypothetical protein
VPFLPEGNPETVIPRALDHVDGLLRRVDGDAVVLDFTSPGRGSYKEHRDAAHFQVCGEIGWSCDRLAMALR